MPASRLLAPQDLRHLSRRRNGPALRQLAGHAALLCATGTLVLSLDGWMRAPALLIHGVALIFLFAPNHEAVHRTVFTNRRANDVLAFVCGLVLLMPPAWFRHFHHAHHRFTQDPDRDPELARPKPRGWGGYLWALSGLPTWAWLAGGLVTMARGRVAQLPYVPEHARAAVVRDARAYLGIYAALAVASLATGSLLVVWLLVVPVLLGQPVLRAYLMAEHTGCPFVPDGTRNTRTILAGWVVRRLAWNMPFHAEHHLYPSVPFHALPALHRMVRPTLQRVSESYPAAHDEIRAAWP